MPLTPADVERKQFSVKMRGYAIEEVDDFLDDVQRELARLLTDNNDLRAQAERYADPAPSAAAALPSAADPSSLPGQVSDGERAVRTLVLAQRTADEAVAEARAEAEALTRAAREESERVMAQTAAQRDGQLAELGRQVAELEARIDQLRGFERDHRARLRTFLEGQLASLDIDTIVLPDAGTRGASTATASALPTTAATTLDAPSIPVPSSGEGDRAEHSA